MKAMCLFIVMFLFATSFWAIPITITAQGEVSFLTSSVDPNVETFGFSLGDTGKFELVINDINDLPTTNQNQVFFPANDFATITLKNENDTVLQSSIVSALTYTGSVLVFQGLQFGNDSLNNLSFTFFFDTIGLNQTQLLQELTTLPNMRFRSNHAIEGTAVVFESNMLNTSAPFIPEPSTYFAFLLGLGLLSFNIKKGKRKK